MAFNTAKAVEVPLSLFGGLVTEMAPVDLPEGVSPACHDVVYAPGKVGGRPGLQAVFSTKFAALGGVYPELNYGKSYVLPNGNIMNLWLDSNGVLYVEDLTNSPGVATKLLQSTPGSYAKSTTAFGREYIAINDKLNGADVPLQFDGNNLDRVTQDGPGVSPTVTSFALPSVQMAVTGPPPTFTVSEVDPTGHGGGGSYTGANIFVAGNVVGQVLVGSSIAVTGNSNAIFNRSYIVTAVFPGPSSLVQASTYFPPGTVFGTGGIITVGSGVTMQRSDNVVTVQTLSAHQLKEGYQVQITDIPAAIIGTSVVQIVINNEDAPGVATVTTTTPHGLVPGLFVSINGVPGRFGVGASVTSTTYTAGIATVVTGSPHGVTPGTTITTSGMAAGYNTTSQVINVMSPTTFTYPLVDPVGTLAPSGGGAVTINWPIPDTAQPTYFEVLSAPTPTTFQIAMNYADVTFFGGTVLYAWDGIFYVSKVLSPTSFQYQQYGPDANTLVAGTVTPYGQAAPGLHQVRVSFLTRQGYLTRPSPPVSFVANGGQYLSVDNIPIGPSNVVARVIQFTGAGGSYFFYIGSPAQVQGQTVSTATKINDNITTSALLDFSDSTLFRATGVSIPGNSIADEMVLDGALAFGSYASRLLTWGQRNKIQLLLNMGFDGGYLATSPTLPTGWSTALNVGGQLAPGRFGLAWQITAGGGGNKGLLFQSFYEDAYGAPIGASDTQYKVRLWASSSTTATSLVLSLTSASTGFSSTATISGADMAATGSWVEATFTSKTPLSVPTDFILSIYGQGTGIILVDEVSIIYSDNPFTNTLMFASYIDNPEGFDGVSGKFGPTDDTRKILDNAIVRSNLYMGTQEPSGRWHETSDNGTSEPAGWSITQVGSMDGLLSAFSLTKSQADDNTASGGEEWFAWASSSGLRIFGGDQPWKISQEIQPDWESINPYAYSTVWALNDPVARVIYLGLPLGTATSPSKIYTMNYRELDTPYQISNAPPVRTSFSGRMLSTDNTRKWAPWNLEMNGAISMYRQPNQLSTVLLTGKQFGNAYTLNPTYLTDDDYGQIFPLYVTFFFVNHEAEIALQLGAHRKLLAYLMGLVAGVGNINLQIFCNTLSNPWPISCTRQLATDPKFDLEFSGGSAVAQRMAIQITSTPDGTSGLDNTFSLEKLILAMRPSARLPVRGAAA